MGLFEAALLLGGLALLWKLYLSAAARAAGPRPPALGAWNLSVSDFLSACFVVIMCGIGAQTAVVLASRYFSGADPDTPSDLRILLLGASFQIGMLAGAIIAASSRRRPGILTARVPVNPWLAGGATFLAAVPLVTAVNLLWVQLLHQFGMEPAQQEMVDYFTRAESPVTIGIIVFFAVVVAPVTEELIFRAGLFRYLRTRIPRWAALILPALIFGALHGNFGALAPLVALAVVFSLAYERTGSIAVPMVAHALFNLNTILLLLAGVTG